jgi:hypothetical protein
MDCNSVFSKTAKGLLEATGKTRALPRDMRALLKEIDSQTTAGEARARIDKYSGAKLLEVLNELVKGNFIRELDTSAKSAAPSLRSPPTPAARSRASPKLVDKKPVPADGRNSLDVLEQNSIPPAGNSGNPARKLNHRSARARPTLLRQTIELSALVVAYLQYFYIDVHLQIMSLPSVTT